MTDPIKRRDTLRCQFPIRVWDLTVQFDMTIIVI
jgi:hypothetical protein